MQSAAWGICILLPFAARLMAGVAIDSTLNVESVTEGDGLRHRLRGRRVLRRLTPLPRRNRSRPIFWPPLHDNVCSLRNEGECGDGIGAGVIEIEMPAGPRGHHHELLFRFLPHVGHRCRLRVAFQLGDPQLFSGPGIEGAEAAIEGGANEDQSSRGGDGTTEVIDSGWAGCPWRPAHPRPPAEPSKPAYPSSDRWH